MENRDSLATRLGRTIYTEAALVPPSPWLRVARQGEPTVELLRGARGVTARVTPAGNDSPHWWVIQTRRANGAWNSTVLRGTVREMTIPSYADRVAIRAVDRASIESPAVVLRVNR
jgi:hypothetical protein